MTIDHRGPGRPSTGTPIHIRIPDDLLARLDIFAEVNGWNRAKALREVLASSTLLDFDGE